MSRLAPASAELWALSYGKPLKLEFPGHLALRWEGMTIEEAQQEWEDVFRPLR